MAHSLQTVSLRREHYFHSKQRKKVYYIRCRFSYWGIIDFLFLLKAVLAHSPEQIFRLPSVSSRSRCVTLPWHGDWYEQHSLLLQVWKWSGEAFTIWHISNCNNFVNLFLQNPFSFESTSEFSTVSFETSLNLLKYYFLRAENIVGFGLWSLISL